MNREGRRSSPGILVASLLVCLAPSAYAENGERGEDQDVVSWLDAQILNENQVLAGFGARQDALGSRARGVEESFPQPMVEYMLDVSAPWMAHTTTGHMVQVMQTLPLPGSRGRRAEPFRREAQLEALAYRVAALDLLRESRGDLVELVRIDEELKLLREEEDLLDEAVEVVRAVTPVSRGGQGMLLELELRREGLLDRREVLGGEREEVLVRLASRTGLAQEVLRERLRGEALTKIWDEEWGEIAAKPRLEEWALRGEPGLQMLEGREAVLRARRRALEEELRPSPQVMLGYMNEPPMWEMTGPRMEMIRVGVQVAVPIFRQQNNHEGRAIENAQVELTRAQEEYERGLRARLSEAYLRWENARSREERYRRELLPLAEDMSRQLLVDIEIGEKSIADFLLAITREIEVERGLLAVEVREREALLDLQRATGGKVGESTNWAYPEEVRGEER